MMQAQTTVASVPPYDTLRSTRPRTRAIIFDQASFSPG
jgi:hypothetical protein